jgi:hypothetical protein
MPTEVGIHDFADANRKIVDGGLSPAVTRGGDDRSIIRAVGMT